MPRAAGLLLALAASVGAGTPPQKDDGYRGIWYYNQPSKDRYVYKYSGGFATCPQQHAPIAVYRQKADKTLIELGGEVDRGGFLAARGGGHDGVAGQRAGSGAPQGGVLHPGRAERGADVENH
jgi:hypothetical protein